MFYIGIDLGTSAVKLLLMDENGKIYRVVLREYPLSFPLPGWSEQDPADWVAAVTDGIRELTQEIDQSLVRGIAVAGQMHGLVVLDEKDQVIRPAILWNDGRTAAQTAYLNEVVGKRSLSKYTGNIAFAGFTAPKLLWMREEEPELFRRIRKIMLPKDYINYVLTGVHCTDVSDASGTLFFDVEHKCWSKEMLEILGIREEQLPKIFESYEAVGTLLPEIAETLGLSENVVVAAGAGDNAAAAVGTGVVSQTSGSAASVHGKTTYENIENGNNCVESSASDPKTGTLDEEGRNRTHINEEISLKTDETVKQIENEKTLVSCNISLGTSGTIFIASDRFTVDEQNALHAFAHADGHYHLMGCMLSAASCNKWLMEDILKTEDYEAEQAAIAPEKLGHNHVYFLPYLMGERSPINDTDARGTFIGMTMDTTRADLVQAVLEGVAFGIRDSLEVAKAQGIELTRSRLCGGGAKSPLWRTILANVLNLTLEIPESEQGPGMGAAMLAMVAAGEYTDVQTVCQNLTRTARTAEPDEKLAALYEERYMSFKEIYPACRQLFKKLGGAVC